MIPKLCKHCVYFRMPGAMDSNIPGTGFWCSNSLSPRNRTRIQEDDNCEKFVSLHKKAPILVRKLTNLLSRGNKHGTQKD